MVYGWLERLGASVDHTQVQVGVGAEEEYRTARHNSSLPLTELSRVLLIGVMKL